MRPVIVEPFEQAVKQPHPYAAAGMARRHPDRADLALILFLLRDPEPDHRAVAFDRQQQPRALAQAAHDLLGKPARDVWVILGQRKQESERARLRIAHFDRSEARRVGKECVSTCRSRWSPYT